MDIYISEPYLIPDEQSARYYCPVSPLFWHSCAYISIEDGLITLFFLLAWSLYVCDP